jgi:hypothetical protein
MKAVYLVHWPGNDVLACNQHKEKLVGLAGHMGVGLSYTSYDGPPTECPNCENEAKMKQKGAA